MMDKSSENLININDVINGHYRVGEDEENAIIYWNDVLVNIAYILKILVCDEENAIIF